MSIRIVFRPSKKNKEEGFLSLRIYHKRQTRQVATGLKLMQEEWDDENSRIVLRNFSLERKNYLYQLNATLKNKILYLEKILNEHRRKEMNNIDQLIADFKHNAFTSSFSDYAKLLANKLAEEKRYRTSEAYLSVMRRTVKFNQECDFSLNEITAEFVENYERELSHQGLSLNTISFYMRNLRAIYNKAIADKILIPSLDNPFEKVYTGVKSTPKRALSKEDVSKIYSLDFSELIEKKSSELSMNASKQSELELARDLFLFSFHTRGMSFVDISFLKKSNIKDDILTYRRKKTGQELSIKINTSLRKIINKYARITGDSPYIFPIIRSQEKSAYNQYLSALSRQNRCLKQIQKLADIKRRITSHVARHTWATIAKEEIYPSGLFRKDWGTHLLRLLISI
ncbi:site-specific integrase [Dysgonomonas sp. Marseille-P4361]|uniref:site-specific integrase n=1 Tax=Dysgonomonas sp. Marseille-P4361 TaxID=2161820 RepID=UPI00135A10BF|nr:site-specific integrase [Dysgonomonas sp. Marseille-P4361]